MIDTPSGGQVPLKAVADVSIQPANNAIQRIGSSRKLDVICNVGGRDLGSVAREIESRVLSEVDFPEGYHPEFLGEYAEAKAYQSPNIARLASQGMRFSPGYSPAPNCSPSRYANLTGKTRARLQFIDIVGRGHETDLKGSPTVMRAAKCE